MASPQVPAAPQRQVEYFIANRLRNIPLVSSSREWQAASNKSDLLTTTTQSSLKSGEMGNTAQQGMSLQQANYRAANKTTSESEQDSETIKSSRKRQQGSQLGKRDAALIQARGQRIQSQGEVLFRQSGSTAAIANVVRATTSTTKRPRLVAQKTTTTRKPPLIRVRPTVRQKAQVIRTTTSTTTRRPPVKNNIKLAKMLQRQEEILRTRNALQTSTQSTSTTTTTKSPPTSASATTLRLMEPISSVKMGTLEAFGAPSSSVQYAPQTTTEIPKTTTTTTMASKTSPAPQQQPQLILNAQQGEQATSLTRAAQTLTTLPVNQRRTQQNVVQSRAYSTSTNRLQGGLNGADNKFAGEDWYLFNRGDGGGLSAFELLVLVSNILIVCTVLVVILFNWIKVFKRKRRASKLQQMELLRQQQANAERERQQAASRAASHEQERISQISSGLSGITSTTANDTTTTLTGKSIAQSLAANKTPTVKQQVNPMETLQNSGQASQQTGTVANKAMAIVQPTENSRGTTKANGGGDGGAGASTTSGDKLKAFKEELGKQARAISRSVSDLSGGNELLASVTKDKAQVKEALKKSADDLSTAAAATAAASSSTPERVAALEQLFKRERGGKLRNSTSSLESIELPASLVEPLKKQQQQPAAAAAAAKLAADPTIAPSPNLLLGEQQQQEAGVAPTGSGGDQKAQISEANGDKNVTKTGSDEPMKAFDGASSILQQMQQNSRPENPMSREMIAQEGQGKELDKPLPVDKNKPNIAKSTPPEVQKADVSGDKKRAQASENKSVEGTSQPTAPRAPAEVKNHQVVVNKLDKRKANLEIVDLRDASVTGNIRGAPGKGGGGGGASPGPLGAPEGQPGSSWISMDGVAVVQPAPGSAAAAAVAATSSSGAQSPALGAAGPTAGQVAMSPSEIIESRFHVDYKSKRKQVASGSGVTKQGESMDSKQEEYVFNNIENELEQDNKMRNRKYFVYIVHDGHFTAKKECIARIELPQKRRITLAELRQLIANSQDISLTSLRRNRFKFVTETYRLLNENEDAAVLHQVYPTQGVFLKLNVAENENQVYSFKGGRNTRLSSSSTGPIASSGGDSLSQATIASRRRANARSEGRKLNSTSGQDGTLPAIEVNYAQGQRGGQRASSVGRTRARPVGTGNAPGSSNFKRSKSSVQMGNRQRVSAGGLRRNGSNSQLGTANNDDVQLPSLGLNDQAADDEMAERLGSFTGVPLAEMSEDRVRFKPRWKAWS